MARKLELDVEVQGAAQASASLGKVGRSIDDIGDEARQAERRLEALGREITETAAKSKLLAASFRDTGDTKFFQEFTKNERATAGLRRMQKALKDTDSEASKLSRTLGAGKAGGGGLADLFGGGFNPSRLLLSNPEIPLAGAAAAAPLVGGTAAAALLGGVGLAGVGAGVALSASDSKAVQASYSKLGKDIFARLQDDASAFQNPLLDTAELFAESFDRVEPRLQGIFVDLSKAVVPLAQGLTGFAEEALPGIAEAAKAAVPFLTEMSGDLRQIGRATGDLFESVSHAGPGAARAFEMLADAVEITERSLGVFIEQSAGTLELLGLLDDKVHIFGSGVVQIANDIAAGGLEQKFVRAGEAGADAFDDLNGDLGRTLTLMRELSDAFDTTFTRALSAAEANLHFEESIDGLTESIKENGKSFDISSEKGQRNRGALYDVLGAIEAVRQAEIEAGGGIVAANAHFDAQIGALRRTLAAAGLTKAQIDALISSWQTLARQKDIVRVVTVRLSGSSLALAQLTGRNPSNRGPAIPAFASGGMVPGRRGAPQLAIVHGGEKITPPGAGSGDGSSSSRGVSGIRYTGPVGGLDSLFLSWLQQQHRLGNINFG
jgi:hypothetical protein